MLNSADQPARAGLARRAGLLVAIPTALLALLAGCGDEGGQTPKAEGGAPTETALAQTDVASETSEPESTEPKTTEVAADAAPTKDAAAVAALEEKGYALGDVVLGDPNAPVTLIEYASLTCPHCADFHAETFPEIKEKYVDTGKVRFVFREFPLDPLAAAGFMLARCAPNDQYFAMIDLLFDKQRQWAYSQDPVSALLNLSKQTGFTQKSFEECLTNQELLDAVNGVKDQGAREFGVNSTPTFFINGRQVRGARGFEEFSKIIDSELGS